MTSAFLSTRPLRPGLLAMAAAAMLALAALLSPMSSTVTAQEAAVVFQVVQGRMSDGSGGSFVTTTSQTISEGLDVNYFVKLQTKPSSNVTVAPSSSSSNVVANTGSDQPLTFTPDNWSTVQNVQVLTSPGAADDANAGVIAHTVSSDDSNYDGLTPSFTVTIVGTNSACTPSAAPTLNATGSEPRFYLEVTPGEASCGSTPIVGYDTAIQEDDGSWEYSGNARAAYPSAQTYSVRPVLLTHRVSSGSTYKVKTRGITYQDGASPWSPVAEITVAAPQVVDANQGPGGL